MKINSEPGIFLLFRHPSTYFELHWTRLRTLIGFQDLRSGSALRGFVELYGRSHPKRNLSSAAVSSFHEQIYRKNLRKITYFFKKRGAYSQLDRFRHTKDHWLLVLEGVPCSWGLVFCLRSDESSSEGHLETFHLSLWKRRGLFAYQWFFIPHRQWV